MPIQTVKALQICLPINDTMFQKRKLANLQETYTNNRRMRDRKNIRRTKISQLSEKKNNLKEILKLINFKENYTKIDSKVKFR